MTSTRLGPWKVQQVALTSWMVNEPERCAYYESESEAWYRAANPLVLDLIQRITSGQDTLPALRKRAARIAGVLEGRA